MREHEVTQMEARFRQIQQTAYDDPAVLALFVTGSRVVGFENEHSDYDCALVVVDAALEAFEHRYEGCGPEIEVEIFTLESFREHAAWGSDLAWDRYSWTHAIAEPDKSGGHIQQIADEKGRVPVEHVDALINESLDWYINQVYRSLKCLRAGDRVGYRLEASESIRPMLQALFCLHDRRVLPYYKYLAWELARFPLTKLRFPAAEFQADLLRILTDADRRTQQKLLVEMESLFRAEGYGPVFDGWQGKDRWAMTYEPQKGASE